VTRPSRGQTGLQGNSITFEFEGDIWYWRGPSPYHFVSVPAEPAQEIRAISPLVTYGWGVIPASVLIGSTEWRTSLFPKDGGYAVPIRDRVRTAEGLSVGDTVAIRIRVP
jgi:hypothetical protein